jgi:hypothetical protein
MRVNAHYWIPSEREYITYEPPDVPAMTSAFELCLFEAYARDAYRGHGLIVDLGCWMGASTHCLARGVDRNKHVADPRPIEVFDLFVWTLEMDRLEAGREIADRYLPGDSYYRDAQRHTQPYGNIVRMHRHDLLDYVPPDHPVEFLVVDAQKSWPLGHSITTGFFPHLIEGKSYVVQQDFCYHRLDEVQTRMIMWYLRDHFEVVHHVPFSSSVVFRCTERIQRQALPAFTPALLTLDQLHAAYEWCYGCVAEHDRTYLRVGKMCHLLDLGLIDEARAEAERFTSDDTQIHQSSREYAFACLDHAQGPFGRANVDSDGDAIAAMRSALSEAKSAGP